MTRPPAVPAALPTQRSAVHKVPLMLFDPYSQHMFACTKPDDAAMIQDPRPAPAAMGGASKLRRVLQLALLSSVAVMIWFMLSILQTAQ